MKCDVCIIGSGPAGLMAGIFAAQNDAQTLIVDSNTIACRKLLHTGRGRCNLTHAGTVKDFVKAYGRFGKFLQHSLSQFTPQHVRQYFANQNLQTKVEKDGYVFPITNRATDVKRALVMHARTLNVRFLFGKKVKAVEKTSQGFVTVADTEKIHSPSVIIATGGVTWPFTGSTGDGYQFAEALGHTIIQPRPCLVPLVTNESWPGKVIGLGIKNVQIKATIKRRRISASGPMMFTEDGISGPAVFDFSRLITDFLTESKKPLPVSIDLMPQTESKQLDKNIASQCQSHSTKELASIISNFLPRILAITLCTQVDPSRPIIAGKLSTKQRRQLLSLIKNLPLSIKSTRPIKEATITRGGVCSDQIDSETMQSTIFPGLFFAGEVINVDGPCGGYNLQVCFSTGALAGRSATKFAIPKTKGKV